MTRRAAPLALAVTLAVVAGACGLGAKEGLADRIIAATNRLEQHGTVDATVEARVRVVPSDQPAAPGPARIVPVDLTPVPALIDLRRDQSAVGLAGGTDPAAAAVIFLGSDLYQRIPPKTVSHSGATTGAAATNVVAILASGGSQAVAAQTSAETTLPPETTTTTAPSRLRRAARIPRQWIGFDYSRLDEKDTTKRAGSFAINPAHLLELTDGVLTGSIEQVADDAATAEGLTLFEANVNRDKAERRLPEERRELLDKIYKANAITKRTFPARIWLDGEGNLRRFEVTLRQELDNVDRADLVVTISIVGPRGDGTATIPRPDSKATASVGSLGQLVTAVSGA